MAICKNCGDHLLEIYADDYLSSIPSKCNCKKFEITDEQGGHCIGYGLTKIDVAIKYAKKSSETEGDYLIGNPVEIIVGGDEFKITAVPEIRYSAELIMSEQ